MTTEINLGNLVIPIIKPQKGTDYYTEAEKQELISIVTDNVNSVVLPQEQTRQENEATRQSNEETRQSQENTRQSNEVSRQTAESARVEAENLRQSNEASRISAEQARVGTFNTQMQAVDTAIAGIHTSQDAYDQNAQNKTEAFNTNATNKMNAYNENASEKIDEYDQHVHDYETELANKVDKVQGKGLSTNDYDNTEKGKVSANTEARHTHSNKSVLDGTTASYTTEEKSKLAGLENYDDTELREDIEQNTTNIEELKQENEDLKKNQLTNTPTPAISHYLQDSADARFRKFIPIGRTTQESTTGKNLANVPENWSFTRYVAIPIDLEAGDYIISIKSGTNNGTTNTNIFIADDNNNRLGSFGFPKNSGEKNANITINSKATKLMCYSQYDYTSGENITATINQFMIRKASVIDDTYEPYTGGEPAPNPKYPFPIKNTGDNGSVNEKVQNANIWHSDLPILIKSSSTQVIKNNNGGIDITLGTGNVLGYVYYDLGKISDYKNKTLTFSIKNEPNSLYRYCGFINCGNNGENRIELANMGASNNKLTITIGDNYAESNLVIRLYIDNGTASTTYSINNIQLEQGSTASSYVPHSEQNPSFPLAQGQKFYEGSHPDDDEKVHHKMGEIDLSTLTYTQYATNKYRSNIINNIKIPATQSTIPNMFAEKYRPRMQNGTFENGEIGITQNGEIILCDTTGTPSGIIQYELAEEQTEDFTEEQKTAWEEIKKARTYKNVTHISSEDETPANVEVEYVRDLETVINNLTTRVETIESEV